MKEITINRFPKLSYNTYEALNTLCINLSLSSPELKKIVITSCRPKEGKSFIAINLMRSMANIGKRVVLVDADLRISTLVSRYSIRTTADKFAGLAQYLNGDCDMEDILYQTNIAGASLIPAAGKTMSSLSLLNNIRLKELLHKLAETNDVVLVDAPPVGVVIDAAEIAKACDGILMVVANNVITRQELADAIVQLERTGRPVLGTVLNKVSFKTRSMKKYYYRTYYSHYEGYEGYYLRDISAKGGTRIQNSPLYSKRE